MTAKSLALTEIAEGTINRLRMKEPQIRARKNWLKNNGI